MNAHLNNTGKVFAVIRSAGTLALVDLVARCNLPPDELFASLRELTDDNLIKIDPKGKDDCRKKDFLVAAADMLAEVSKEKSEPQPAVSRAELFFALNERFRELGSVPVAAL
jgi:hypothetical protein